MVALDKSSAYSTTLSKDEPEPPGNLHPGRTSVRTALLNSRGSCSTGNTIGAGDSPTAPTVERRSQGIVGQGGAPPDCSSLDPTTWTRSHIEIHFHTRRGTEKSKNWNRRPALSARATCQPRVRSWTLRIEAEPRRVHLEVGSKERNDPKT